MNPIFGTGPSLNLRFLFACAFSLLTFFIDIATDSAAQIRHQLNTLVSPIQYLGTLPQEAVSTLSQYAVRKQHLVDENQSLRKLQLLQNEKLQRYNSLKAENDKLRALLNTQLQSPSKKKVADIMEVASHPFSQHVVIDKGSSDNVFEGQTVIDDSGIVGQIVSVGNNNSRIILLTDQTHAIPITAVRTGIRGILQGTGNIHRMSLTNIAHETDIQVGDELVTSGLGGVFDAGYPVAEVTEVIKDASRPFINVSARPIAQINRLKHVLLLWPNQ